MKLKNARILLTGATGGIGAALTETLAERGARLVLVGRDTRTLADLCAYTGAQALSFDLTQSDGHQELVRQAAQSLDGLHLLINAAGVSAFEPFERQDAQSIAQLIQLNLTAPMLLSHAALPLMRPGARIVNIGSVFGAIGHPYFSAYCASKFGLRGFSEALRRELRERDIGVTYIAPRAVRTAMNSHAVYRFGEASGMTFDAPQTIASRIADAIEAERDELTLGGPESFFVKLNALMPSLVGFGLRGKAAMARSILAARTPGQPAAHEEQRIA